MILKAEENIVKIPEHACGEDNDSIGFGSFIIKNIMNYIENYSSLINQDIFEIVFNDWKRMTKKVCKFKENII